MNGFDVFPASRPARRRPRRARRGFTLVEILVVVSIIALLAGVVVWRVMGSLENARRQTASSKAAQIGNAMQAYMIDGGTIEDGMDLSVLLLPPDRGGGPSGPYLNNEEALVDPWQNAYVIRVPGEVNYDFDIVSYGPDGQPGGGDDVTN